MILYEIKLVNGDHLMTPDVGEFRNFLTDHKEQVHNLNFRYSGHQMRDLVQTLILPEDELVDSMEATAATIAENFYGPKS